MNSWFTTVKIDNTTYAISENSHPQQVHSYLLLDEHCACLIDTGLGIHNIKEITSRLTNLPIKVITTHTHFDHIGGHKFFDEIYVHEEEADWLRKGSPMPLEEIREYILEEPLTKPFPLNFSINNYYPYTGEPASRLKDNDIVVLNKRKLRIIHTPGHSPGHICIFEENRGYLFTGDLLYKGTLYAFLPESDPSLYRHSLEKISRLKNISRILPSHNDLDIAKYFIQDILIAFNDLDKKKQLKKGTGIYNYDSFKISL